MRIFWAVTLACILAAPAGLSLAESGSWHSTSRDGQPMVTGSGRIVREARPIGNVHRVELMGSSNLHVRLGERLSLTVEADDNLLPQLTTEIEGGVLRLDSRGSFRTRTAPRVYLTAPNLDAVITTGSGNVVIAGVSNRRMELVSRGSGKIIAKGRTGDLVVKLQGSGNAYLQQIAARHTDVGVYGSGKAWIHSNGAVRARSYGSGNVYVLGRPASLDMQSAGSGKVVRLGGR